jgi:subtilisin-like proprotein convertase family protein
MVIEELSGNDVIMAGYTGACGSLAEIGCSTSETNILPLAANTTYRLMIGRQPATAATLPYSLRFTFTPNTGRCCVGSTCSITTASNCASMSGTYGGDDSPCVPPQDFSGGTNIPFVIDSAAGTMTSVITVGPSFTVSNLSVSLNLTHTFVSDLVISLTHGSTTVNLHTGDGGETENLSGVYTFTDSGAYTLDSLGTALGTDSNVVVPPGKIKASTAGNVPVSLNSAFAGQNAAGTWTVTITDDAAGDTGTLNAWTLSLTDQAGANECAETPCQLADHNDSGGVDADDLFAFLDDWFAQNGAGGPGLSADVDHNDVVDADDLFVYLDLWFAWNNTVPCP